MLEKPKRTAKEKNLKPILTSKKSARLRIGLDELSTNVFYDSGVEAINSNNCLKMIGNKSQNPIKSDGRSTTRAQSLRLESNLDVSMENHDKGTKENVAPNFKPQANRKRQTHSRVPSIGGNLSIKENKEMGENKRALRQKRSPVDFDTIKLIQSKGKEVPTLPSLPICLPVNFTGSAS